MFCDRPCSGIWDGKGETVEDIREHVGEHWLWICERCAKYFSTGNNNLDRPRMEWWGYVVQMVSPKNARAELKPYIPHGAVGVGSGTRFDDSIVVIEFGDRINELRNVCGAVHHAIANGWDPRDVLEESIREAQELLASEGPTTRLPPALKAMLIKTPSAGAVVPPGFF